MRRLLVVLLLLATAAAAPTPLRGRCVQGPRRRRAGRGHAALHAHAGRARCASSPSRSRAERRAQVFAFDAARRRRSPAAGLAASPQKAAIALSVDDDTGDFTYTKALAGPPTGPFTRAHAARPPPRRTRLMPVGQPGRRRDGVHDRGCAAGSTTGRSWPATRSRTTCAARSRATPRSPRSSPGDLVGLRRPSAGVVVQDWRTGAVPQRHRPARPDRGASRCARDGRAAAVTTENALYDGAAPDHRRRRARSAFAGERIVYRCHETSLRRDRARAADPALRRPDRGPRARFEHRRHPGACGGPTTACCWPTRATRGRRRSARGPCPRSEIELDPYQTDNAPRAGRCSSPSTASRRRGACSGTRAARCYGEHRIHDAGPLRAASRHPGRPTSRVEPPDG